MSLLTIVRRTFGKLSLPQPATVFSSTDRQTIQALELLYDVGEELRDAHDWSWAITQRTFTCGSTEAQSGEPPADFHRFTNPGDGEHVVWNDSDNQAIIGPVSASEWTEYLARGITQGHPQLWRIIDGVLNISSPVSGETIRYEYVSNAWIGTQAGAASAFNDDTNTIEYPESLVRKGLLYKFLQAKRLSYKEEMRDYQLALAEAIIKDKGAPKTISSDGTKAMNLPAAVRRMWHGTVTG